MKLNRSLIGLDRTLRWKFFGSDHADDDFLGASETAWHKPKSEIVGVHEAAILEREPTVPARISNRASICPLIFGLDRRKGFNALRWAHF
jgi:hypothetical protein